jgi:hypothetical protein
MNQRKAWTAHVALSLALSAGLLFLASCGGGSGNNNGGGNNPPPVNNSHAVEVNFGPAGNYPNGFFTSVNVCLPNSSNCQMISNVLVDTGSEGLRVLSGQLSLSLPAVTDNSGNALQECVGFADGSYVWGPVVSAEIQMAGEQAGSVPIQVINAPGQGMAVPSGCASGGGANDGTVAALGANGILGIGNFRQDCGSACTGSSPYALYYLCPGNVCQVAAVSLDNQVQNPVWAFAQDNNGLLITLPTVSAGGAATATGSLIFGIGTQSNNALGTAQVYTTDAAGNFQTTYNGVSYGQSFIDSGSNALFFLDATTLGIPDCPDYVGFYCPSATTNYTATNTGLNGTTGAVSFSIANAHALFATGNAAFNNLGGDNTGSFDWGLPFFYGRNVFVGIEGQTGPNGAVGPYWAY